MARDIDRDLVLLFVLRNRRWPWHPQLFLELVWCVRRRLMRPIPVWHPLPQVGHMWIGLVCWLLATLALHASRFFSAASVLLSSAVWAPLWRKLRHVGWSAARFSQVWVSMEKSIRPWDCHWIAYAGHQQSAYLGRTPRRAATSGCDQEACECNDLPIWIGPCDEANDAGHVSFLQNFSVGDFVLPADVGECPKASEVKVVQLLFVTSVGSPALAAEREGGEDYWSVNFKFGSKVNSSPLPNCLPEPPKRTASRAGFGKSVADRDIYVSRQWEGVFEVGEIFNSLDFLTFDCVDGVVVWAAGSWLKHRFSLFGADVLCDTVSWGDLCPLGEVIVIEDHLI